LKPFGNLRINVSFLAIFIAKKIGTKSPTRRGTPTEKASKPKRLFGEGS
jgi:hypothetical protein